MQYFDNVYIDICKREDHSKLYDIRIDSIPVYYYIRRYTRKEILKRHGFNENIQAPSVSRKEYRKTIVKSIIQIVKLLLCHRKYDNFIYSFYRTDKVNNLYLDKFTDPLIDYSSIGDSYVIFEVGRAGRHLQPRAHQDKVVFADAIYWLGNKLWKYKKGGYAKNNHKEISKLYDVLVNTFPEVSYDKDAIIRILTKNSLYLKFYHYILKKIHAKRLIAPSRADFEHIVPAAKRLSMKVFELQHGITYGETLTYSGFFDHLFSPDYFLSFGKIESAKCYGITEDKVIEIGWAFDKYIQKQDSNGDNLRTVLVISSPDISETMVVITSFLATKNPDVKFIFRPHPNEQLDKEQLNLLTSYPNIKINNNTENIITTLLQFTNVMGENSTVLYEAQSLGKKVGRLKIDGLTPRYLTEEDRKCFYEITNNETFIEFINAPKDLKPSKKLYTDFKPEEVNRLLFQ